jgi:hypothetical protein
MARRKGGSVTTSQAVACHGPWRVTTLRKRRKGRKLMCGSSLARVKRSHFKCRSVFGDKNTNQSVHRTISKNGGAVDKSTISECAID